MAQVKLAAQRRTVIGRNHVKAIKREGLVPAVIYGAAQQPLNLQLNARELLAVLSEASGEHFLVELEIDDNGNKSHSLALVQEVQHHPLRNEVLHVDFHAVSATEKMTAEIPIETTGEAIGVKTYAGLLEHPLRTLEVECLPSDLPEAIYVDVSNLNIGDAIHVRDLQLPPGVVALANPDQTVASVVEPRVAEAEEEAAAAGPTVPELVGEKPEEAAESGEEKA
jgi:large subunit ribosomal protein L25